MKIKKIGACAFKELLCSCATLLMQIHLQNISFSASSAETKI